MALVAGRDGLHRLPHNDDIHPFFRLDTQKDLVPSSSSPLLPRAATNSQLNHELSSNILHESSQEMTKKDANDLNDPNVESVTSYEPLSTISRANGDDDSMEQNNTDAASGSGKNLMSLLGGPTTADSKPVRKRRKLGSRSEVAGSGKQGTLPWYSRDEESTASAPHKTEALSDQDVILLPSKKSSDETAKDHLSAPKKVMKLRADGRLFSPPKKDVVIRPIKEDKKAAKGISRRLAVWKYGNTLQSRREIGETIERILNGTFRIKSLDKDSGPSQGTIIKIDPPTKADPHPFFLAQRKLEGKKDQSSALPKSRNTSRASSPHRLSERAAEKPATALLFGSNASKIVFPNESQEPIWPPQDMLHIRDQFPPTESTATFDRDWTTKAVKKAKEPAVSLVEAEEIWYPLKSLATSPDLAQQVQWEGDMVLAPIRQIIIRSELQAIVSNQLQIGTSHEVQNMNMENKDPRKYTCKSAAAQKLFDTLQISRSAFDNFKCENQGLTVKFAPKSSGDVLQSQDSMQLLKSWLSGSSVHSTSSTTNAVSSKKKRKSLKKRRQASELDDFIASSEDDDLAEDPDRSDLHTLDMTGFRFDKHIPQRSTRVVRKLTSHSLPSTKAVVISGPHGCGKTAAVYALAQEVGFEVFEINAGSRRSGRDILEKVGDMTKNHLVSRLSSHTDEQSEPADERPPDTEDTQQAIASGKQSTMQSFFMKKPASKPAKAKSSNPTASAEPKPKPATGSSKTSKAQKQSLILLEEVDVLFEEDKQFWTTVISLIATSKRPLIMTCTDESVLPIEVLDECSLVQFSCPPKAMVAEYLLLIAAHEGHLLSLEAVSSLYIRTGLDLRASIMQLSFWCQMAIKDDMNGLNWILFPQDYQNNHLAITERRVMSQRTFLPHMGVLGKNHSWSATTEANAMQWMHDAALECDVDAEDFMYHDTWRPQHSQTGQSLDDLSTYSLACDVLSAADILQSIALLDKIKIDKQFSEAQQFNNFTVNPPVLQSTQELDMMTGNSDIISVLNFYGQSAISRVQRQAVPSFDYYRICDSVIHRKKALVEHQRFVAATTCHALDPLVEHDLHELERVATDFAPYIRSIVSYDNRLKQERDQLDKLLSDGPRSGKRQRTTRASRAALEGGHKANTRRERWFECELDFPLILETGGQDWQEIAWAQYQKDLRKWKWTKQVEYLSSEDELCS